MRPSLKPFETSFGKPAESIGGSLPNIVNDGNRAAALAQGEAEAKDNMLENIYLPRPTAKKGFFAEMSDWLKGL